jgi:hypothetical protein
MTNAAPQQLAEDWQVLSQKTNDSALKMLSVALRMLFLIPIPPATGSSVTWTVRRMSTGEVRRVTASSEEEARKRIQLGLYDES